MKQKTQLKKLGALICMGLLAVALAACSAQQASSSASSSASSKPSASSDIPALVVPNVVSLTMPDAEKAIVAAGFKLGDVTYEASETVPTGNVISQKPESLTQGSSGTTVAIVVSSGHPAPKEVKVPDVKGMNQTDAENALAKAGLTGICAGSEESTASEPGTVFKQSIDPDSTVTEKTKVTFTLALAPSTVKVPNVIGKTEKEANALISQEGLGFDTVSAYSSKVAEGLVIDQAYAADTEVQRGTTVTVTMSLGPAPAEQVTVPNVLTYTWSDAEYALESAGLVARHTGDPSGVVIDQDFDGGSTVEVGTVVTLTLSTAEKSVEVPNLIGLSVNSAEIVTDNAGLSLDGENHGEVIDQQPAAGTMVEPGTTISVKVDTTDFE